MNLTIRPPSKKAIAWSVFWVIYELAVIWFVAMDFDGGVFDTVLLITHLLLLVWFSRYLLWRVGYMRVYRELLLEAQRHNSLVIEA